MDRIDPDASIINDPHRTLAVFNALSIYILVSLGCLEHIGHVYESATSAGHETLFQGLIECLCLHTPHFT